MASQDTVITDEFVDKIYKKVMNYFKEISAIPRESGNEAAIADYLMKLLASEKFGLKPMRTSTVINGKQTHTITASMEAEKGQTVNILQSHIDMVCQKISTSKHDFATEGIEILIDGKPPTDYEKEIMKGEKMCANGTTLGSDDGIGVACALAMLELACDGKNELNFPPLQMLFTSDEEVSMTGAMAVTEDFLGGIDNKRLINIDTETEGTMYYGCAGGIDTVFNLPVTFEPIPNGYSCLEIQLSGLLGGHSGVEIHKKRANANKLMARTLRAIQGEYAIRLVSCNGGDKHNVITKEATAVIAVESAAVNDVVALLDEQLTTFCHEYEGIETSIQLTAKKSENKCNHMYSQESTNKFINAILLIPNDVLAWHGKVEGLVETSCNLGVVRQNAESIYFCSFIRSFFSTKKLLVVEQMRSLAKLIGAVFTVESDFPDWEPNPNSELVQRFNYAYKTAFPNDNPNVESIHAGLECGYFSKAFPNMDMIACGPTITGAHTPEETLYLDSTKRVVKLLLTVLSQMNDDSPKSCELKSTDCANNEDKHEHSHICACLR